MRLTEVRLAVGADGKRFAVGGLGDCTGSGGKAPSSIRIV